MSRRGTHQFIVDLVEAAESRGYVLVALDTRIRRERPPFVRVMAVRGRPTEIELSTEYGLGLEELIDSLPRGDEERALT